jgi:beta-lactamase regulating signal transducer with metallopeptidase domain
MEAILTSIGRYLINQTWQIAAVFAVVVILSWCLRGRNAHVRYLLWLVVLIKCLVPPIVSVPVAVLSPASPNIETPPTISHILPVSENVLPVWSMPENLPAEPVSISPAREKVSPLPAGVFVWPTLTKPQWCSMLWLACASLFLLLAIFKAVRTQRRFKRARQLADSSTQDEVASLARQLGLRRTPRVWQIAGLSQPFVWGLFRGSIYLPGDFADTDTPEHRRGVLMHELAHIARFDAFFNVLQIFAQSLFFFHPLVWIANARIRREREKCCDEIAIANLNSSPKTYSSAIVETLVRSSEQNESLPTLAVVGPVKNIEDRIKTIMLPNKKFYARPSRVSIATVLLLAAVAVPTTFVLTTRANRTEQSNVRVSVNDKDLDELLLDIVEKVQTGNMVGIWNAATKLAERKDSRVIPILIGLIDSDNTNNTVYGIGYYGLSKLTGVEYSTFHDGAWWRRWWEKNKSKYSSEVQKIAIPDLPKTTSGKEYKPFPEELNSLDGKLQWMIEKIKANDAQGIYQSNIADDIAKANDFKAIPILIGIIDADNSYPTVYGVGYFALSKLTGVEYSTFHDGAWWRRWWEKNKSKYSPEVQKIAIPDLPKTKSGENYKPFPEELDSLDGKLQWMIEKIESGDAQGIYSSHVCDDIAKNKDPKAIPVLIGIIDADNSYPTVYGVGYFALSPLTGVSYSEFHDGAWWRQWWEKNKSKYSPEVQKIAIPDLPKTKAGKNYKPYPEELDTLNGKLKKIVEMVGSDKKGKTTRYMGIASDIAEYNNPSAIPVLIHVIEADNTYDTIYGVGYYGLRKLTGVEYDKTHDGKWWRQWWQENKAKYTSNGSSASVKFIDFKERENVSRYYWLVSEEKSKTPIKLGCFVSDRKGMIKSLGDSIIQAGNGPVDICLEVTNEKGAIQLHWSYSQKNGMAMISPTVKYDLPQDCSVRESHLADPAVITNVRYQTLWNGRIIRTYEHGTEYQATLRFVAKVQQENESAEFQPPTDPLPVPSNSPFVVYGTVRDEQGKGVSGATVRIATGWGTLIGGGETITDAHGRYRLRFGPGIWSGDDRKVRFQAAVLHVDKKGFYEANLCRQGNLAMTEELREEDQKQMKYFKGVVLPNQPYRVSFVMKPAARLVGELVDENGRPIADKKFSIVGENLYPATNVLDSITTDANGQFVVENIPCYSYWFDMWLDNRNSIKTSPVDFSTPGEYVVQLEFKSASLPQPTLTVKSIKRTPSSATNVQSQPTTSSQKIVWPENIVGVIQRSVKFFDLTFQANDLMQAGQVEKALAIYRRVSDAYADLDTTGYVKLAMEECSKKLGKKIDAVKATSEPATMAEPAPAKVLDIKTIHVGYVHPVGKTRIIRTTMKILGTDEMENNPPGRNWSTGIYEVHYTCLKVNPDGSGVYEVSMPLEEQIAGTLNGTATVRYEKGKPAHDGWGRRIDSKFSNPKFYVAAQNVNAQVTFTMIAAADGTPLKVEGYQKAYEKQINEAMKDIGPLTRLDEQQLASRKKNATDESMLRMMKSYRPNLPEGKTLHVGDTWMHNKSSDLTYRLESVEMFNGRPCAKIQMHITESQLEKPSPDANVQNATHNSESNGYLYLDYEKGEMVQIKRTYSLEFKQTITKPQHHLRQTRISFLEMEFIEQ